MITLLTQALPKDWLKEVNHFPLWLIFPKSLEVPTYVLMAYLALRHFIFVCPLPQFASL